MQDADERAQLRVLVRHRADAFAAAAMVKALAHGVGSSAVQASMIATATTELAQNIVSHAGGDGEVMVWLEGENIVVQARSVGVGDGGREAPAAPTRGGLGQGQAAVRRMMDSVVFESASDGGLVVTARVRITPLERSVCW
ncbi:MAG: ATP-binding protein [Nannocystales bacterium]